MGTGQNEIIGLRWAQWFLDKQSHEYGLLQIETAKLAQATASRKRLKCMAERCPFNIAGYAAMPGASICNQSTPGLVGGLA